MDSDLVLHFVHRHETPIFGLPVVEQTNIVLPTGNNLQLCYKPAGIPVHPSSHYNKHSLTELVHFNPSNRLDRLVSGYLLGGNDPKDLRAISMLIQSHDKLLKMYIAEERTDMSQSSLGDKIIIVCAPLIEQAQTEETTLRRFVPDVEFVPVDGFQQYVQKPFVYAVQCDEISVAAEIIKKIRAQQQN